MEATAGCKREVAKMAWPLAIGLLSFTMMGVVDTLLMGRVGTEAQAGVALGASLTFCFAAFFRGLSTGAQSLVAAADGAGNRERVHLAAGAGLWTGAVTGVLAGVALALIYEPLLVWVVLDPEILFSATSYLSIRVLALPFALMSFGTLAALQGLGDMKTRMWVSIAGNVLNVVLDLVLIFGAGPIPAMGATGAGLATAASGCLMAILYLARFLRLLGRPRLPGWDVFRSSLAVGLPAGLQVQLHVFAMTVMNLALARVGAAHLAASQIVFQIINVSFLPGYGVGEAGGVLVGRYLGAGKPGTAARSMRSARTLAVGIMGAFGLLFALEGSFIASLFTQDPEVVRLAGMLMLFAASFQLLDALATVHLCALRGAGDTKFTLVLTSLTGWGLTVPAALLLGLGLGWGAPGAWLGLTLEVAALAAISGWRVRGIERGQIGRLDLLLGKA